MCVLLQIHLTARQSMESYATLTMGWLSISIYTSRFFPPLIAKLWVKNCTSTKMMEAKYHCRRTPNELTELWWNAISFNQTFRLRNMSEKLFRDVIVMPNKEFKCTEKQMCEYLIKYGIFLLFVLFQWWVHLLWLSHCYQVSIPHIHWHRFLFLRWRYEGSVQSDIRGISVDIVIAASSRICTARITNTPTKSIHYVWR